MTPDENRAMESLWSAVLDLVDKGRGLGLPSAQITSNLAEAGERILSAVRSPLEEQIFENRRGIEALEAQVKELQARLA